MMVGDWLIYIKQCMAELHTKASDGVRVFVYGTLKPGEVNFQDFRVLLKA